jgi:hypothetical protein
VGATVAEAGESLALAAAVEIGLPDGAGPPHAVMTAMIATVSANARDPLGGIV